MESQGKPPANDNPRLPAPAKTSIVCGGTHHRSAFRATTMSLAPAAWTTCQNSRALVVIKL
jgi:hypothetical protein